MKVRATPFSFGGIILSGIVLVVTVLAWAVASQPDHTSIQTAMFVFFMLAVIAYAVEAASESLELRDGFVTFDSILRRKKRVNVCAMDEVLIVHEGLNLERGIVSVVFRASRKSDIRVPLGPLWRRRDLERFFANIEEETGECKLVGEGG